MNVLMLTNSLCMDGVTTCVIEFSNCLYKKGHNVCVCGSRDTETDRLEKGIKYFDINFYEKNPIQVVSTLKRLYKIVKNEKIDIIHCHWRMTTVYARILTFLTPAEMIWQNHLIPIPATFFYRIATFYGKKAIAISNDGKIFLHESLKIPEEKIEVINNGISLDKTVRILPEQCAELKKKYDIRENEKVIVLFGRLEPVKGHEFLLNAVKNLQVDYKLILTGEGSQTYKDKLVKCVAEMGLEGKIIFSGNVKANEILSIADVMVLPSLQEGFPVSVIEALALRVPVVRTKTGGYIDMMDCVDGVEYDDVENLTGLLEKNLAFDDDVQQRTERAYKKVQEVWDVNKVVDRYLEVYRQ